MASIDLGQIAEGGKIHNLSGKPRGEDVRRHFELDRLDRLPETVEVVVPGYIWAISSSFFLGMFSRSLEALGSPEAFWRKYRFRADANITAQIHHGLERAAMERSKVMIPA